MALDARLTGLPCAASDGRVVVGDARHDNGMPLPFDFRGPVHFWLQLTSGAQLNIRGSGIAAVAQGERAYLEEFS